ncbi:hypothetical protein HYH03_004852 [Edaphochlamys debaryana]|uniref:Uncharacterized protein n=1 Tax=Edaphochlamys debaryana TaxID=47281 RepID=A0A835Y747_9CHLO|nr:hypothetical protein HYH03_004852 [Edaphochlamys debaryana]|eukprot:KAG2497268.1 hypothetical protein HYH03_004852 [Edaphochlamys debaryana]
MAAFALPPPTRSTSLADLLGCNLANDASKALYLELIEGSGAPSGVANVRLACKGLRELVDAQAEKLRLHLGRAIDPGTVATHCQGGRWMQRWPSLRNVGLVLSSGPDLPAPLLPACLPLPFAAAPFEARKRIKALSITCEGGSTITVPGATLLALLLALPELETLELDCSVGGNAREEVEFADLQLASSALSSLPRLTSLTVGTGWEWLSCIGPSLAAHLTHLVVKVDRAAANAPGSTTAVATSAISQLSALQELTLALDAGSGSRFAGLGQLTAALPRSLRRFTVTDLALVHTSSPAPPDPLATVTASLHDGTITELTIGLDADDSYFSVEMLGKFLANAFPEHSVGRLVPLNPLQLGSSPPDDEQLAKLLSLCGETRLPVVCMTAGSTAAAALAVAQALGMPDVLTWAVAGASATVQLRRPGGGQAAAASAGSGRGGGGSKKQRPAPSLAAPSAAVVLERVLERVRSGPLADAPTELLLRGPFVAGLVENPRALRTWVRCDLPALMRQSCAEPADPVPELCALLLRSARCGSGPGGGAEPPAAQPDPAPAVLSYRLLPAADAVVLTCSTAAAAAAALDAARRLAEATRGGGGKGAVLQAHLGRCAFATAVEQELQAMWDGEGAAGPGVAAGEEGEEGSALDRLRWLLGAWEGLRSGPGRVHLGAYCRVYSDRV